MARSDSLFVTEAQCANRLGLSLEQFKIALHAATQAGFPMKDPLFADRRYWPAVRAWLDRRYGMHDGAGKFGAADQVEPWRGRRGITAPPGFDGEENWKK